MNILILGNGFDLAHGLKTKYSEFMSFCTNFLNDEIPLNNNTVYKELSILLKPNLWYLFFFLILNFNSIKSNEINKYKDRWFDLKI
jgi:hypothetical protein